MNVYSLCRHNGESCNFGAVKFCVYACFEVCVCVLVRAPLLRPLCLAFEVNDRPSRSLYSYKLCYRLSNPTVSTIIMPTFILYYFLVLDNFLSFFGVPLYEQIICVAFSKLMDLTLQKYTSA